MNKKYCVIVDAYSTSRYLAAEFISRGYECIHVSSPGEKADFYKNTYQPQDFVIDIQEKDDINKIIEQLASFPIACVVAGSDPGVIVADEIAYCLGLKQNDLATSMQRRDKHLMAKCLAAHNLAHIQDLKSNDPEEIVAWAYLHDAWPVVIKPINGAATEGLSICHNIDEVTVALDALLNQTSFLGHCYGEVMAQPFLQGEEYIVNTVSCDGHHYVSDIWQAHKVHSKNIIYDKLVLLPAKGAIQEILSTYIINVINALGFQQGPAHSEVLLTKNGPILIEVNGRIMGLGIPNALQKPVLGNTQISLTAEAFVDREIFMQHAASPYKLHKNMVCVSHQVKRTDCIVNEAAWPMIKQLPSFSMNKFSDNGVLPKTIDLLTSPGWILLIHEDMAVIENDIRAIREIEEQHLFVPHKIPAPA